MASTSGTSIRTLSDINVLKVGGKTFDLMADVKDITEHIEKLTYVNYGWIFDNREAVQSQYAMVQGERTNTLPTTGSVHYTGKSIYSCVDCNNKILVGESQFTADFAKKTLTGKLLTPGLGESYLNVKGTINRNSSFSGTHEGTQIQGAFFGPDGKEVAGVFRNPLLKSVGSFGATAE